jgi:hypothetical protein
MSTQPSFTDPTRRLLAIELITAIVLCGCGGEPPMTPKEFLEAEQLHLGQVDYSAYEEVDFGKFKATHVDSETRTSTMVQFKLFAIVRPGKAEAIKASMEANRQRIRDRVIVVIQTAEFDQLTEPSLKSLKYDLLPVIREALRTSDLRDIALDDFQLNTT